MNSKALAHLQTIETLAPAYRLPQSESIAWILNALEKSGSPESARRATQLYKRLQANDSIAFRSSVLADYAKWDGKDMRLFKASERGDGSPTAWSSPPLQDRMNIFADEAQIMMRKAFAGFKTAPHTIVEVSCTGYRAPYPAQKLVLERGWDADTRLLKIGHMGCYAAVPALHLASQIAQSAGEGEKVSVVNLELCSLHLDPLATDPDQIVSNSLFADGCSRMDIGTEAVPNGLSLFAHYEALIPDSEGYMSWELRDERFHMTLSRKVVTELNRVIDTHLTRFLSAHGLTQNEIGRFAIHPGGPRIIESIQEALGLSEAAVAHSQAILKYHGNMSSATLPHVWKSMMDDDSVRAGEWIVSMAFGPGLTVTLNLLRKS